MSLYGLILIFKKFIFLLLLPGPGFAPIGINGFVKIDAIFLFDFTFFVSVFPENKNNLDTWILDIDLKVDLYERPGNNATLNLLIDELSFIQTQMISSFEESIHLIIKLKSNSALKLWWPSGYGDQQLYNLTLQLEMNGESLNKTKQIGFRSVELVEEPVSDIVENGLSFYFKINNVDIFLLGSNWIPADSFQELIDEKRLMYLLESATKANMNVLRIWGGGLYEQDTFYELTDKLGILIWHDFMFACSVRFV